MRVSWYDNLMITRDRLNELLTYDPVLDVWTWIKSRGRMAKAGSRAGTISTLGYVIIRINARDYCAHRLVWFWYHHEWPRGNIDHIDGNRRNNVLTNLRVAEYCQNSWNRGKSKVNTSGFKGVFFHKATGKWQASIRARGKQYHLKLYLTPEAAHRIYVEAAKRLHGEFASN